jgi:NAD(P)-dependent dehydrogenase (short-subunit alcohol dehydrogenase family)
VGRLEGKGCLITGGASGIGRAAALLFAREGAKVAVAGRRAGPLEETVRLIQGEGGSGLAIPADLTDPVQAESAVQRTAEWTGTLRVLLNNHGTFEPGSVVRTSPESWDRVVAGNLRSVYLVCRTAVPLMGRGGSIINIASTLGMVAMRDAVAYCAAKGGLLQLTRAMALDHARDGIRVNAICPGVVETPMWQGRRDPQGRPLDRAAFDALHPLGRMGKPEDVAALALYLASDESEWMTGSVIPLDGGLTAS